MHRNLPFWEDVYEDIDGPGAFGPPSSEIVELADLLLRDARVLDLGCGDGRHAIYLSDRGFHVSAIDISQRALRKLNHNASIRSLAVETRMQDLRDVTIDGPYDLIIAHGCLHLIERVYSARVLKNMKQETRAGGYNVIAVFTDAIDAPDDLLPFMLGLFREGDLLEAYAGWQIKEFRSYIFEDDHPGGVHHRHALNKIVARKPGRDSI